MKILEITYYEDNDIQLQNNKYWENKQNVNLFIDGELTEIFDNSLYETENMTTCMEFLNKNYPKAKIVKQGTYPTGWDYMQFEIE